MDRKSLFCVLIGAVMLGLVTCQPQVQTREQMLQQAKPNPDVCEASMIAMCKEIVQKYRNEETCNCRTWPDNFNTSSHFYADFTTAGAFVVPNSGVGVSWHVRPYGTVSCHVRGVLKLVPPSWATKLTVDMGFKNPTEWSFNLGDSISNNGWGGDYGHDPRCAEVHSEGSNTFVYRAVYHPTDGKRFMTNWFYDSVFSGPFTVQVMKKGIRGDQVNINNYAGVNADIYNDLLFAWDTMYLGINRVVLNQRSRVGTGLCFINILWGN